MTITLQSLAEKIDKPRTVALAQRWEQLAAPSERRAEDIAGLTVQEARAYVQQRDAFERHALDYLPSLSAR